MSDFASQAIMGAGGGYDARTLSVLAGGSSPSFLDAMNLSHIEGRKTRQVDMDRLLVEFQSVLAQQMLKAMRATVPPSGLFGESAGREVFESFLDGEYARSVSEANGGLGLTDMLRLQMGIAPERSGDKSPLLQP